jgi:hypothetical protein
MINTGWYFSIFQMIPCCVPGPDRTLATLAETANLSAWARPAPNIRIKMSMALFILMAIVSIFEIRMDCQVKARGRQGNDKIGDKSIACKNILTQRRKDRKEKNKQKILHLGVFAQEPLHNSHSGLIRVCLRITL